jgi:hypothetical protein
LLDYKRRGVHELAFSRAKILQEAHAIIVHENHVCEIKEQAVTVGQNRLAKPPQFSNPRASDPAL